MKKYIKPASYITEIETESICTLSNGAAVQNEEGDKIQMTRRLEDLNNEEEQADYWN